MTARPLRTYCHDDPGCIGEFVHSGPHRPGCRGCGRPGHTDDTCPTRTDLEDLMTEPAPLETKTQHWMRRGKELDRMRKADLCALYRQLGHVWSAHPLETWRKDEIINGIIDAEWRRIPDDRKALEPQPAADERGPVIPPVVLPVSPPRKAYQHHDECDSPDGGSCTCALIAEYGAPSDRDY